MRSPDLLSTSDSDCLAVRSLKNESYGEMIFQAEDDAPRPVFDILRTACPPTSPARRAALSSSPGEEPRLSLTNARPFTTFPGHFLSDAGLQTDYCTQPDIQDLVAFFIRPLSWRWTGTLYPIFSMAKTARSGDILVPPWYYYYEVAGADGPSDFPHSKEEWDSPWEGKRDLLFWRGTVNGGLPRGKNFRGWVRSRILKLLRGPFARDETTPVLVPVTARGGRAPAGSATVVELPSSLLSETYADVLPTHLDFNHADQTALALAAADPSLQTVARCNYDFILDHKMVLDLDGTSYSGRFLTLQNSSAAVVKERMFKEYLDDSLIPWYHYVPLSVRLLDTWNLLAYFFGTERLGRDKALRHKLGKQDRQLLASGKARTDELRKIGEQGKQWARRCARREDMVLYVWRLALEWARILSDERDEMYFDN